MIEKMQRKKWIIVSAAVGVLAASSWGYYAYTHKQPAAAPAAYTTGGQMTGAMSMEQDVVMMDAKSRQLAGVQTAPAANRVLSKEIKTTGRIALNENGRSYITARITGRIDEVYVNYEGAYVAPGQAIASIYSPDLISAQEEYVLALDSVEKLRGAGKDVVQMNKRLLESARRRLELWGISADQIAHLEHTRKASTHMTIQAQFGGTVMERQIFPGNYVTAGERLYTLADLSNVWMNADIYEKDIQGIQVGQEVVITTPAYPGQSFTGRITFINPIVDDTTRTVRVRAEFANPDGSLKPNMFTYANIRIPLGEALVIPASSLLDTGSRKVVYVAQSEDTFVKRDVVVGQEAEGFIQILSGLQPNETVITAAAFLIDSQTKLGSMGGHGGHGGGHGAGGSSAPGNTPASSSAPVAPAAPNPSTGHGSGNGEHSGH